MSNGKLTPGFIYLDKNFVDMIKYLKPNSVLVYLVLKARINHKRGNSIVFPSRNMIIKDCGWCKNSGTRLSRALKELEDCGLVKINKTWNKERKEWNRNEYTIRTEVVTTSTTTETVTKSLDKTVEKEGSVKNVPGVVSQSSNNQYERVNHYENTAEENLNFDDYVMF